MIEADTYAVDTLNPPEVETVDAAVADLEQDRARARKCALVGMGKVEADLEQSIAYKRSGTQAVVHGAPAHCVNTSIILPRPDWIRMRRRRLSC